jgi:hypothetical protein
VYLLALFWLNFSLPAGAAAVSLKRKLKANSNHLESLINALAYHLQNLIWLHSHLIYFLVVNEASAVHRATNSMQPLKQWGATPATVLP